MTPETVARRRVIRRHFPTLMDSAATLRLVMESLEEVLGFVMHGDSSEDPPGPDPIGGAALHTIIVDVGKIVSALCDITGEDFLKHWEEVENADEEDEPEPKVKPVLRVVASNDDVN